MRMDKEIWNNNVSESDAENLDGSNLSDVEEQRKSLLFDDSRVRKGFMRKVYLILMAQLLLTLAIVATFVFNEMLRAFVLHNPAVIWPAFILLLAITLILICCDGVRRQTPLNYIFLGIFTVAQSLLLAVVACQYGSLEILFAVGITAATCLALSLYALQTKYDFTMMGGVLLMSLVVFLIFGIFTIFFPVRTMLLVHGSLGAVLFGIYIIYDTQLMMGGQHKYALSPEEYVYAALNLYLDIVNIFLYVLSLISSGRT